ncbi:pentatricopeptide repeat-containing protein At2g33680 isoform X2 [Selaginella moellendorffii]|nr:pentatricopeptide repeat-containing protein At2g33680 isoform X2 [Selaginella moellendorffii]|eukprot:XP_024516837.1 pentatricopeptide repeat-containing protein At2g33680 isoform X2 [Selaginella moellendorffii]
MAALQNPPETLRTRKTFTKQEQHQDIAVLINAMKQCRRSKDLEKGRKIHAEAIESGNISNIYVSNTLIDFYAKCGSMNEARSVFDKLQAREVVSWNTLVMGYVRNGQSDLGLDLFSAMLAEGCTPNGRTFVAALKACLGLAENEDGKKIDGKWMKARSLEQVMALHVLAVNYGCELELFVASSLVDVYAKCGALGDARRVFDRMKFRGVVSWTALMLGYIESGESEVAVKLFPGLLAQGCGTDARALVAVLKACTTAAAQEEGTKVGDGKVVKLVLLERGMAIHRKVLRSGTLDIFVLNTLVDLYASCGSMVDAQRVFDTMPRRDAVSWNVLMLGYVQNQEFSAALSVFSLMMQSRDSTPNYLTFVAGLKACGKLMVSETGRRVHAELCRHGLENDAVLAASLVDFYGKSGRMVDAEVVFEATVKRDVVTWTALAVGYCRQGNTKQVLEIFHTMQEKGLQPDGIMFLSILTACSHAGMVNEAKLLFEVMRSKYGVSPDIEHYHCMADLLGRASQVDEAVDVVKTMPFRANVVTWTTVLGACRKLVFDLW